MGSKSIADVTTDPFYLLICPILQRKSNKARERAKEAEREVQLHRLMRKLNRLQKFIQYLFD